MRTWPSLAALAVSVLSAAVVLFWGGQDQQGQFHAEYLLANRNIGTSLFFLGPYLLLAISALVAWGHKGLSLASAVATVLLCGIGVLAAWIDHQAYLRTPPGRETLPFLNFLATLFLWLAGIVLLAVIGILRVVWRSRPTA